MEKKKSFFSGITFKMNVRAYAMIIALLAIWVFFTINTDGAYIIPRNLSNLARQMSVTSILAVGMVLILVAGHIDLSVGSTAGLVGGVTAILHVIKGWPAIPSILAGLALGILIGLWQGYWVAYKNVPAFIVTLSGMMVFRGVLMGIANGRTIAPLDDTFKAIGQAYIPQSLGFALGIIGIVYIIYATLKNRQSRMKYGFEVSNMPVEILKIASYCIMIAGFIFIMDLYKGIPVPVLLVVLLVLLFTFISTNTSFGRHIYAIGGNVEAARLSGINIKRKIISIFIISGLLSAVAGIVLTARLNAATISAGQTYELDAIASCVIGGTSTMGGSGTIAGAIVGALVMASLDNGMSMMNTEAFWQYIIKGMILLLAVWLDISSKKKQA